MTHKLKKRIEALDALLNPPAPPRVIWCERTPDVLEPGAIYVRWRTKEEHEAAGEMAARAVD
jgi:hypothetical protein